MNNRKLFNDKEELQSSMFNYLNIKKENTRSSLVTKNIKKDFEFGEIGRFLH